MASAITALVVIMLLASTFFMVHQRTAGIVQGFGKLIREAGPALSTKIPFINRVVARINLQVQQLDVRIETKTEDTVFVPMVVAVQSYVLPENAYDAYYKLGHAQRQITSYLFDLVRVQVPKIKLDDVFEKKDEIAESLPRIPCRV
jgi:regulator of protease activity HflC (stomatin/prohibitin superfamily)